MIERSLWNRRLAEAWRKAPLVWLTGPRRVGKTVLAQSLPDTAFFNCDLPSVGNLVADPERFFRSLKTKTVVLDEVHQIPDPSRLLKIGTDAFPKLRILATGSSTLAATKKFRDSLTGRKRVVELVPILHEELPAFGIDDLPHRLLRGGLPPALLAQDLDRGFYSEWLDSYFARDVQEMFHLEKRASFLRALTLLLRQSGGMLEASSLAAKSEVSRPTIVNWLEIFQVTHAVRIVRPYAAGGRREVIAQPKAYGFDTGFVCHARGWDRLRSEDLGVLWEHLVLESLVAGAAEQICFWRDKQQREVDFVLPSGRQAVDAIECKWRNEDFTPRGMLAFRESYPRGRNFVVTPDVADPFEREIGGLAVQFLSPAALRPLLHK